MTGCDKDEILLRCAHWLARHGVLNDDVEMLQKLSNLVTDDFSSAKTLAKTLDVSKCENTECMSCNRTGLDISRFSEEFRRWVHGVLKYRLPPQGWDQVPVSSEQALLDVADFANRIGNEQNVLFIGDDDFHSLLLSKLLNDICIQVVDIDPRIVEQINCIARKEHLNVEAKQYDVRQALPNEMVGIFDAFYADPPYNFVGLQLFTARGLEALQKRKGAWGALVLPFTHLPINVRETIHMVQTCWRSPIWSHLMIAVMEPPCDRLNGATL